MSKMKFFALGGIGEVGQNMYVLEIDDKIFVFDCGSSEPMSAVSGYDYTVPNYEYLSNNMDKVQAVFITNFSQKSSGGFPRFIKDLKVPYYGSKYTMEAIDRRILNPQNAKQRLPQEYTDNLDLHVVNLDEEYDFDGIKVRFLSLTGGKPETIGVALKVNVNNDEDPQYKNIIYLPDFNFDMNSKGKFKINFKNFAKIADEGVFLLLTPSTGAPKLGHVTTDGKFDIVLHKMISHPGRLFCVMDGENISSIYDVIKIAAHHKRQVTIISSKTRSLVETAMDLGYIDKYEGYYISKDNITNDIRNSDNSVIIVSGEQVDAFNKMVEIATLVDKNLHFKPTDNVVFLIDTPKKYEKLLAKIWDCLMMFNSNLVEFDVNLMPSHVLGSEDLKLLYSLFTPEYIIPISGDYRMIKAQIQLARDYGYDDEHVIEMEIEDVAKFDDGKLTEVVKSNQALNRKDILFSASTDSDINDLVAGERDALTREGFLIITAFISLKERERRGDIRIVTYGFLPEFGQEEILDKLKVEFDNVLNYHLRLKKVDFKELRLEIKNALSKIIFKDTRKKPVLIPVVIDIAGQTAQLLEQNS